MYTSELADQQYPPRKTLHYYLSLYTAEYFQWNKNLSTKHTTIKILEQKGGINL